jgi:hypothetical protein
MPGKLKLSGLVSQILFVCLFCLSPGIKGQEEVPPLASPTDSERSGTEMQGAFLTYHPGHLSDARVSVNVVAADNSDLLRILVEQVGIKLVASPYGGIQASGILWNPASTHEPGWGKWHGVSTMNVTDAPFDTVLKQIADSAHLDFMLWQAGDGSPEALYVGTGDELRAAFHEAGHALAAYYSGDDPVYGIHTLIEDMPVGYTVQIPAADSEPSLDGMMAHLNTDLGGAVAEKIVFGSPREYLAYDWLNAVHVAETAITEYGLTDSLVGSSERGPLSESPHEVACKNLVNLHLEDVQRMLEEHRDKLELLGTRLLEVRDMNREEFLELVGD